MKSTLPTLLLSGALLAGTPAVRAGTFSADFNDAQVPIGSSLYGNNGGGVIEATGGVGNSGTLKLTKAAGGQQGNLVVDDLDGGLDVNGVTATWKMRVDAGSGTPADGFSFNVANGLGGGIGPEGAGNGLRVVFDTYNNTPAADPPDPAEAPAVDIYWNGSVVAHLIVPYSQIATDANFADVTVKLDTDGTLDVIYNGRTFYSNYLIPGYFPINSAQYAWGAATGGEFENHFVDDISLTTTTGVVNPGILTQPRAVTVLEGYQGLFFIQVNEGAEIQWEKKAPADAGFSDIAGETGTSLRTAVAAAADSGTLYRATVTLNGISLPSAEVALTTATLPPPAVPEMSYTFNDGAVPAGTEVRGNAAVVATGGVAGSGYLELVPAVQSQAGSFILPDTRAGAAVDGFFAHFQLNMTPTSGVAPADGFGLHFASDIPAGNIAAEEPVGTGLSVCFDVYDNGGGEAPSVDVFWRGAQVATVKYPGLFLDTQNNFADVRVRLEQDGTVDVVFNGTVAISNLQLTGTLPISGGQFAFSARTGGAYQIHALDEVAITTQAFNGPVAVIAQPADSAIVQGYATSFSTATNDPSRTTFQWQRREPGGTTFADIAGATASTYTTPATAFPADNQAAYRVVLTSSNATTATSDPAILTVVNLTPPAAAQVAYNFNTATLTNTGSVPGVVAEAAGVSVILPAGGVGGSGVFEITRDAEGQYGGLFIRDFNSGNSVGSFKASFAFRSGGAGTPADGWSFSWGTGFPATLTAGDLEQGIGNDLRVSFDIYDNAGGEAPAIDLYWRGVELAHAKVPLALLQTGDGFEQIHIEVDNTGRVYVSQDGIPVHNGVQIPGFVGVPNADFAFAGRTGGAYTNQWVDDFSLQAALYVGPIAFTAQPPAATSILSGTGVTLSVAVNDPARTTFKWQRKLPSDPAFTDIAGATAATYNSPALTAAENGVQYRAVATATTNEITSAAITVSVFDLGLPAVPELNVDFADGLLPIGGTIYDTAVLEQAGGIDDSPYILLTPPAQSQAGSAFILEDLDAGLPVTSMTAEFYLRIWDGSAVPADGISFSWGTGIPDAGFRDDGAGNDLRVSFDTYNNSVGGVPAEAPAIELKWRGESLGNIQVPLDLLMDPEFVQVVVRVTPDGTCDITYDGEIIFWRTALPGWAPLAGARYAWGAGTGGQFASQSLDDIRITTSTDDAQNTAISIGVSGGNIVVNFSGVLETSTDMVDWDTVTGAVSPLVVPISGLTGQPRRFWRAVPF